MQFTPKFQSVPRLLGLEAKQDASPIPVYPYGQYSNKKAESEHTSPIHKNKISQDSSPFNLKKDTYEFTLTPRNLKTKGSLDSLDNFSSYANAEPFPRPNNQIGTFHEASKRAMQNTGNAIAYGFNENINLPVPAKKVPKLESLPNIYTPKNDRTNDDFGNILQQVKETLHSERTFGRSNSTNINITYGLPQSDPDIGGSNLSPKKDIHNESLTNLIRFNSDSPKKKKAVRFKVENTPEKPVELPPIAKENKYDDEEPEEFMMGNSKVKTKYLQHEYLGVNMPTIGTHSNNSSSLLLMKIFKKTKYTN